MSASDRTTSRQRTAAVSLLCLAAACTGEPAMVRQVHKDEAAVRLSRAFWRSVEAEKSAVLATSDEESTRLAEQSRQASAEVQRQAEAIRQLVEADGRPEEVERLAAFQAAWAQVVAIDARLLPLAEANTNLKATHLSTHQAAAELQRLLSALEALQAGTAEPGRLRALSRAATAALTIQTLHAPHIASPSEPEMDALEARIAGLGKQVDAALAASPPGPALDAARGAWADYRTQTEQVLRLSRANTNVLSFSLSLHEKRDATDVAEAALRALSAELRSAGPRPTR